MNNTLSLQCGLNDREAPGEEEVTCLNCGHIFRPGKVFTDKFGPHVVCPKCGSSFDVWDIRRQ